MESCCCQGSCPGSRRVKKRGSILFQRRQEMGSATARFECTLSFRDGCSLNNTTSVYVLCDVVKLMGSFGSHCTRWSRILASDIDTTRTYEVVENDARVAHWKKVQWKKRKSEIMKLYDVLEIQWDNGSKQNLRVPLDVQRAEIMMFSYGWDNRVYDWKKILLQEFISNVVEMGTKFDLCDVLVR